MKASVPKSDAGSGSISRHSTKDGSGTTDEERHPPAGARQSAFTTRRLILILVALGGALLGLVFTRNLIDFPVYYAAGQSLGSGRTDLYAPDFARGAVMDYRYPPFFLIALTPLWLLPYSAAAYVWYLMGLVEIGLCVTVLERLLGRWGLVPRRAWVLAFFAVAQYFVMMLHYGNAHLLVITLIFCSLYLLVRGRDAAAAPLMALAITIKLIPVLLFPYFVLKRRFKFLTMVLGVTALLNLAPAVYFGPGQNLELLRTWYRHVVADQEFHEVNGPIKLSLKGQLRRYLTFVDYERRVDGDTRYPAVNLARWESRATDRVWLLVSVLLFAAGLALIWRCSANKASHSQESDKDQALEISLMLCLMLVAGPLTSKIYFIALLWPVVVLAVLGGASAVVRRALILIAVLNAVAPLLPGRSTQRLLLVVGVDFYLACLLMVLSAYSLWVGRQRPATQAAESQTQSLQEAKAP